MAKLIHASDKFHLGSSRTTTADGYLVARGTIARTGVQDYRAFELELDDRAPMSIVRLYRPPEEVFAPDSMQSFEGAPITIDHPADGVSAETWSTLAKGDARQIERSPTDMMDATLTFRSKDAIDALDSGKSELSNGYTFELDMTPGRTPTGQAYDGVQRKIRGNHVALVDAARCGSACRVADSKPSRSKTMKIVVDGIPLDVADDTTAAAVQKLLADRDTLKAENTALKAAADKSVKFGTVDVRISDLPAVQTAIDKLSTELETVRKDVMTPAARDAMVADWAKMSEEAKRLKPDVVMDGKTCADVRKEVIAHVIDTNPMAKTVADAVLAGRDLKALDADAAKALFNAVVATVPAQAADGSMTTDAALAHALTGGNEGSNTQTQGNDAGGSQLSGREKFMANSAGGWQNKAA